MPVEVTWWGHATATVRDSGVTVLTDPLLVRRMAHLRRRRGALPPVSATLADVVLVSHLHADHLHALVPARRPLGFLSAAMGGLGFAIPAAAGVRMGAPERPVVAVVGDGSSLYQIQALWTAAHYGVGILVIVLANSGYAVMDRLAELHGGAAPWPPFEEVSVSGLATALGCPARRVTDRGTLRRELGALLPSLGELTEPLVLEVAVAPDPVFQP